MKNNSVLTALVRKCPKAFKKRPGNWRPLQRDIETSLAILAPEISSQEIEMALHVYTSHPSYLRHLVEGPIAWTLTENHRAWLALMRRTPPGKG